MTESKVIGETGENIATRYLKGRGFDILERNHRRPWGELDIVAMKDGVLRFVEVKAMAVHEGQGPVDGFLPESHMGFHKMRRLKRVMETYLVDKYKEGTEPKWQLDLVAVELDMGARHAKVRFYEGLEIPQ